MMELHVDRIQAPREDLWLLRRGRETGARVEFLRKRKVLKIVPETLTPKTRARKETKGL
jgi:hypothetical protein